MRYFAPICLMAFLLAGCSPSDDPTLPHTVTELNRWYVEPPTDQNAATIYLQGFAALKITPEDSKSPNLPVVGNGRLPSAGDPVPPVMKAAIADFLQRNRPALDLFEKAAELEQSRYPLDLTKARPVPYAQLSQMSSAAEVIQLSALSHALDGDGAQAGGDVLTGFTLAKSLEDEPILTAQFFRSRCNLIAVNSLQETLKRTAIPTGTLSLLERKLKQVVEDDTAGKGLIRGVVGERVLGLDFFNLPVDQQQQTLTNNRVFRANGGAPIAYNPSLAGADKKFLAESYLRLLDTLKKNFPKRLAVQDLVKKRIAEARSKKLAVSSTRLPQLEWVAAQEANELVYLEFVQTAVALERFRAAQGGHYPGSLGELVPNYLPAKPEDPFNGSSLHYNPGDGGYFLYSVGPDGKDDGGLSGRNGQGDIVFALRGVPAPVPQ